MVIDAAGRIDIFGVSVNTNAGHTSVLGHWTFTPSTGWGSAAILLNSPTDFRQGLGLANPVAGRDGVGHFVLAWSEQPAANAPRAVRAMRYSGFSSAWTPAGDVAPPAAASAAQTAPVLSVNESGRASLAWMDTDGGTDRIRHARLR
jgi:hypothetical protein